MITIQSCPRAELNALIREAHKVHVLFPATYEFFCIRVNGVLAGACALKQFRDKAVFTGSYVFPECRGRGLYKQMLEYRLGLCRERGIPRVQATCTDMSIREWEARGARPIQRYKKFVKVEIVL